MATQPVIVKASKEFLIPPDEALSALAPGRLVDFRGERVMAYPHTTETTRLARNMGHKVQRLFCRSMRGLPTPHLLKRRRRPPHCSRCSHVPTSCLKWVQVRHVLLCTPVTTC